ncbi:MAG: glycerophosphodiester phosphodiesterase family protein [Gemmiger sp.]
MVVQLLAAAGVAAAMPWAAWWCIRPGASSAGQRSPFVARSFAHRGLFDPERALPENSLPAFAAAAEAGYGIELDVQCTADGQVVVFHDAALERMTGAPGRVREHTWAELRALHLGNTGCRIPLLSEVLALVAGRVPLIVEVKSEYRLGGRYVDCLCGAVMGVLRPYAGAYCVESFDPRVLQWLRRHEPGVLRGQLADCTDEYRRNGALWLPAFALSHCAGNFLGRPQFIAWCPARRNGAIRHIARMGAMMVYWTALPGDDAEALQRENDAVIFQGYRPAATWKKT